MSEKPGDIFYRVLWEPCPEELEAGDPLTYLDIIRVRTVRRRRKTDERPTVTAYTLVNHLTVTGSKQRWLERPDPLYRECWASGKRPAALARSKSAAYRAALASVRRYRGYDPNDPFWKKTISGLKAGVSRSKKR